MKIENLYLVLIFILMAFAILSKSYFDIDGYLSNDSTSYLQCAQNLLDGNGYQILTNSGMDREFFAVWPISYPTIIFIVAKILTVSPLLASKILNIFLIAIIIYIFKILFKKDAYIYGVILLFSSYIEIFSYSWSETLFITMILWFSTSIYLFIVNEKNTNLVYLSIFTSSILLFLSRYIGAFSFGIIGLIGLYYFFIKKDIKKSIILIVISIINISIMVSYLYYNYTQTGFITGMPRINSPETNIYLFILLIKSFISEMLIPIEEIRRDNFRLAISIFLFQSSILGIFFLKYRNLISLKDATNNKILLSIIFSSIGLIYLFFIILMRWLTQFDQYNYRLLAPGTFLIFIAIIYYLKQKLTSEFFSLFKKLLISLAIFSYLLNISLMAFKSQDNQIIYIKNIKNIKNKYDKIDKDSIVIFAPNHIKYLYIDMSIKIPYSLPYNTHKEKWSDFVDRIKNYNRPIYLNIPKERLSNENYHHSVIKFLDAYKKGSLVKLN